MAGEVTLGSHVSSMGADVKIHTPLTAEEVLKAARFYHSLGWAVTAGPGLDQFGFCACKDGKNCRNPGKHAYKGWGEPTRQVMTIEQIEKYWSPTNELWQSRPVDHLFIVPYLSGLIVADVDYREKWLELPEEMRPDTLYCESGSGRGGHYFYRYDWNMDETAPSLPGKLPRSAGELKFRGIVVAAPSLHKSGGQYSWSASARTWFENGIETIPYAPKEITTRISTTGPNPTRERMREVRMAMENSASGKLTFWDAQLLRADVGSAEDAIRSMKSVGNADTSRPVRIFAAAAGAAKWIDAGGMDEDTIIETLLDASIENGAMDDYGEKELTRQIRNGIEAGKDFAASGFEGEF